MVNRIEKCNVFFFYYMLCFVGIFYSLKLYVYFSVEIENIMKK